VLLGRRVAVGPDVSEGATVQVGGEVYWATRVKLNSVATRFGVMDGVSVQLAIVADLAWSTTTALIVPRSISPSSTKKEIKNLFISLNYKSIAYPSPRTFGRLP
jgi:hypothetical protein